MFRKIVSLIPFSPSYLQKLGPLESSLSKEHRTRKIGLVFLVSAIGLQLLFIAINHSLYSTGENQTGTASTDQASIPQADTNVNKSIQIKNITRESSTNSRVQAQEGELLEYRLTTKNLTDNKMVTSEIRLDLSDVLEYSDIIDAGGAVYSNYKNLIWPKLEIGSGGTITQTLLLRVKSPLPISSTPANNPTSFDSRLQLFYGNYATAELPVPISKIIERYVKQTPHISVVYVVFITILYTLLCFYYLLRSGLLAKESRLIREQFKK